MLKIQIKISQAAYMPTRFLRNLLYFSHLPIFKPTQSLVFIRVLSNFV